MIRLYVALSASVPLTVSQAEPMKTVPMVVADASTADRSSLEPALFFFTAMLMSLDASWATVPWPYPILFGSVPGAKAMYSQVRDGSAVWGKSLNPAVPVAAGRWAAESGVGPDPALTERC
jgi:hypothetical protein